MPVTCFFIFDKKCVDRTPKKFIGIYKPWVEHFSTSSFLIQKAFLRKEINTNGWAF